MTRHVIDTDEVLADLQTIVTEYGDGYVDPNFATGCCYYHPSTGAPSCIVGHVLNKHGLLMGVADADVNYHPVRDVTVIHYAFTPEAEIVLEVAQSAQDAGKTWGEALVAAKEAASSVE